MTAHEKVLEKLRKTPHDEKPVIHVRILKEHASLKVTGFRTDDVIKVPFIPYLQARRGAFDKRINACYDEDLDVSVPASDGIPFIYLTRSEYEIITNSKRRV